MIEDRLNDEIKEILNKLKETADYPKINYSSYDKSFNETIDNVAMIKSFACKQLLDYITNLQEKIEYNDLVLKALHKYFIEHEFYEIHEFLRQLESCTESDMVWLKRMAGVNNER